MAIWQVEIYDNRGDPVPVRRGFIDAADEETVVNEVMRSMGDALHATMTPHVEKLPAIPTGIILWESL
jgi:hypothetical protein